ncbi:MAG: hypothetical protein ACXVDH_00395 [Nocardioides sp.]
MKIALGRPARGTLAAATVLLAAVIGAGSATAAPSENNGRHVGQDPAAAPAPHGSVVRSQKATAAQDKAPGKAKAQAAKSTKATAQAAKKNDKPSKPAGKGQGNTNPASSVRGAGGDPPGNNGTVKIAALGDLDRIPNNTPHPGCSFEVQWYGFDGGSDVVSTVSFTPQAPTRDVTISVDGPTSVPVGEDAASGAGTATGLDAVQAYTLSFSGGAPAKQGYHVRLTVATPRSLGNDTKTKVFWVEPCDAAPAAPQATPASIVGPGPRPDAPGTPGATPAAAPAAIAGPLADVGSSADAATPVPGRVGTPSAGVPTAIDAGERRNALARAVSSPWGIGLIAGGAVLVALGAVVARRRV